MPDSYNCLVCRKPLAFLGTCDECRSREPAGEAIDTLRSVMILYKNHRGETAERRILPHQIRFGDSEWHPEPQWLLDAIDLDKGTERTFALRDVLRWGQAATTGHTPSGQNDPPTIPPCSFPPCGHP